VAAQVGDCVGVVVAEHLQAGAALARDGLGVLGTQAQRDAAAAQRVGGRVADRGELVALCDLLDGWREESFAPIVCLAFAEVAGARAGVAGAVLCAG